MASKLKNSKRVEDAKKVISNAHAKKVELTKKEKEMMFNVKVVKVLYALVVIINFTLNPLDNWLILFNVASCVALFLGLLGMIGYGDQYVPMVPWGVIRLFQWIIMNFIYKELMVAKLGIILVVDLAFLVFILFDKSKYCYRKVEE